MISKEGVEYSYLENDSSKGCIVICSGANVTLQDSQWLQTELFKYYSVLLYNRGRYGNSILNVCTRTPDVVVDELRNLLVEIGINDVILLGASLGGYYARLFTHKYPHFVKAVVTVDTPICNIYSKIELYLPSEIKGYVKEKLSINESINTVVDSERNEIAKIEFARFSFHNKPVLAFYNSYLGEEASFVSELIIKQAQIEAQKEQNVLLTYSASGHDIISNDSDFFFNTFRKFVASLGV
ncbi:alpha/beta fold hydrolase [Vibrio cyclitrophicus]